MKIKRIVFLVILIILTLSLKDGFVYAEDFLQQGSSWSASNPTNCEDIDPPIGFESGVPLSQISDQISFDLDNQDLSSVEFILNSKEEEIVVIQQQQKDNNFSQSLSLSKVFPKVVTSFEAKVGVCPGKSIASFTKGNLKAHLIGRDIEYEISSDETKIAFKIRVPTFESISSKPSCKIINTSRAINDLAYIDENELFSCASELNLILPLGKNIVFRDPSPIFQRFPAS